MKFIYFNILSTCLFFSTLAQAPQGFNYQGVARNSSGVELPNQLIGISLSILNGSATGTAVYTETHSLTTDANGLFTLTIGLGSATTGTFSAINWAIGGSKWLKISMDATGGSSYQLMGASQLLSVPYALFAGNVANNGGKQTIVLSDNVTDAQGSAIIASEFGPNTQEIKIVGTTNLTTVDLSMLTTAINIAVADNSALTSLNLGGLTRCDGDLIILNCPALNNLNLNSLTKITTGNINFVNTGLSSINLNNLVKSNGNILIKSNPNLTAVNISGLTNASTFLLDINPILSSISLPALTNAGLYIRSNNLLSSINFPVLSNADNGINFSSNSSLTSVNFPSLVSCLGPIYFSGHSGLSSLNFPVLTAISTISIGYNAITNNPLPALTSFSGTQFSLNANKLTVSVVNSTLAKLVSISPALNGKIIQLQSQNPLAPPSGQGITDKNVLTTNGNSVITD